MRIAVVEVEECGCECPFFEPTRFHDDYCFGGKYQEDGREITGLGKNKFPKFCPLTERKDGE